ncbi:MAG: hypothetical protein S4CHLAM20_12140 [Chlamydiia bacterium]|nr:hypothetical protein [Chlamydiia bacterium]
MISSISGVYPNFTKLSTISEIEETDESEDSEELEELDEFIPPNEQEESEIVKTFVSSFPDIATKIFEVPILKDLPCCKKIAEHKDKILIITTIAAAALLIICLIALFFMPAAAIQTGLLITALVAGGISALCGGHYLKGYFLLIREKEQFSILEAYNEKLNKQIKANQETIKGHQEQNVVHSLLLVEEKQVVVDLQAQLEERLHANKTLQTQIQELIAHRERTASQYDQLEQITTELERLNQKCAEDLQSLQNLPHNMQRLTEEVGLLEAQRTQLNTSIGILDGQHKRIDELLNQYQEELDKTTKEKQQATIELSEQKTELEGVRARITKATNRLLEVTNKLSDQVMGSATATTTEPPAGALKE